MVDVTDRTAFHWWQNGQIKGYQLHLGTIVVDSRRKQAQVVADELVAIYSRVSGHAYQANLERHAGSLEDYCAAKGYRVQRVVKEIYTGVNDTRCSFLALLPRSAHEQNCGGARRPGNAFWISLCRSAPAWSGAHAGSRSSCGYDREDVLHNLVSVMYS